MFLEYLTISQVTEGLKAKDFTCQELVKHYLDKIESQPELNSFITVFNEGALAEAKAVDVKINAGEPLDQLAGVPVAIKDIILVKGTKTTAASKILSNYIATYDASLITKLKESGAIILGKNNCDEFAMGSSTETSVFGAAVNPWNKERVPGGSSGGSAVAVAADQCTFAIGTDTGGSIRQPASFTGVVGLKPTYGRVSRSGMISMTSSLDQAGPLTRCVADAAMVYRVLAGQDERDFTTVREPVSENLSYLTSDITGKTIGVPKEYFLGGLDKEIESSVQQAIKKFQELGARIKTVSLPHTVYSLAVYYIIMPAEVSSNLARYDGVRYGRRSEQARDLWELYCQSRSAGFGAEVKRRVMLGTYVLSAGYQDAYYKQAKAVQLLIQKEYRDVFKQVDVLLTPTAPTPAFKLAEKFQDPLTMYLSDIYTVAANIAGLCGVSVPCGLTKDNLTIGLQILGGPFAENNVLNFAYLYEQATDWHNQHP